MNTRFKVWTLMVSTLSLTCVSFSAQASLTSRGGISGGGGNVLTLNRPDHPEQVSEVARVIDHSQFILKSYLQKKYKAFYEGRLPDRQAAMFRPVFETSPNITQVVDRVNVTIEASTPCYTSQGVAVDGSVFSANEQSVCMSAKTIALKVPEHELHAESTALLLHEYSEWTGVDEDAAIELQKQAIQDLGRKED